MTSTGTREDTTSKEQALQDLFVLFRRAGEQLRQIVGEVAAGVDLTPSHFMFLSSIDNPTPMGALAEHLCLDASYVTGVVDHLEQRHLVERRTDPADRRRTLVAVTPEGRALRKSVHTRVVSEAPIASRLDTDELVALSGLLRKAVDI